MKKKNKSPRCVAGEPIQIQTKLKKFKGVSVNRGAWRGTHLADSKNQSYDYVRTWQELILTHGVEWLVVLVRFPRYLENSFRGNIFLGDLPTRVLVAVLNQPSGFREMILAICVIEILLSMSDANTEYNWDYLSMVWFAYWTVTPARDWARKSGCKPSTLLLLWLAELALVMQRQFV